MNKVQLVGRLTADPTVSYGNNGSSIARFNVACDRRYKQEGQPTADFIGCVAFSKTAEFVEKYFKKGMRIGLCGRIQTGSYEKDGKKIYTTDIVCEEVEFVESKQGGTEAQQEQKTDDFMKIPDGIEELPFN